jgi:hypothetical protein
MTTPRTPEELTEELLRRVKGVGDGLLNGMAPRELSPEKASVLLMLWNALVEDEGRRTVIEPFVAQYQKAAELGRRRMNAHLLVGDLIEMANERDLDRLEMFLRSGGTDGR